MHKEPSPIPFEFQPSYEDNREKIGGIAWGYVEPIYRELAERASEPGYEYSDEEQMQLSNLFDVAPLVASPIDKLELINWLLDQKHPHGQVQRTLHVIHEVVDLEKRGCDVTELKSKAYDVVLGIMNREYWVSEQNAEIKQSAIALIPLVSEGESRAGLEDEARKWLDPRLQYKYGYDGEIDTDSPLYNQRRAACLSAVIPGLEVDYDFLREWESVTEKGYTLRTAFKHEYADTVKQIEAYRNEPQPEDFIETKMLDYWGSVNMQAQLEVSKPENIQILIDKLGYNPFLPIEGIEADEDFNHVFRVRTKDVAGASAEDVITDTTVDEFYENELAAMRVVLREIGIESVGQIGAYHVKFVPHVDEDGIEDWCNPEIRFTGTSWMRFDPLDALIEKGSLRALESRKANEEIS